MNYLTAKFPNLVAMWDQKVRFVLHAIHSDRVVIFSKTECPYCIMAKEIFRKLQQPYTAIELDTRPDGDKIQDVLMNMTGVRSVPRIFIDGKFVGGASDLKELYENGKLNKLLGLYREIREP